MSNADRLVNLSPQEVIRYLGREHISRVFFVYEKSRRRCGNRAVLQPVLQGSLALGSGEGQNPKSCFR